MDTWDEIRQKTVIYEDSQIRIRIAQDRDCNAYFRIMGGEESSDTEFVWNVLKKYENLILYAVTDTKTDEMIGTCHARLKSENRCEFGYEIAKEYQGLGFGTKAMEMLITIYRNTPFKLIAKVKTENKISRHIISKLGGR